MRSEIVFRALSGLSNPELLNINTGEFVRINAAMTADDEFHIYTHFAGKSVTQVVGTSQTNAFPMLDVDSTFLQLAAGNNTLRYNASNIDILDVSIFYRPQFLRV